ncbi:hypothetical protein MRX96_043238 [Rhipicephalus microplus]
MLSTARPASFHLSLANQREPHCLWPPIRIQARHAGLCRDASGLNAAARCGRQQRLSFPAIAALHPLWVTFVPVGEEDRRQRAHCSEHAPPYTVPLLEGPRTVLRIAMPVGRHSVHTRA